MPTKLYVYLLLLLATCLRSQMKVNIYLFSGQGSDYRIFDSLQFDQEKYNVVNVEYSVPTKGMSLQQYSQSLLPKIDTLNPFILIGVSLGGMICCELSELINVKKTIIISSAKGRSELPFRYRFQKTIPLYKLFPPFAIKAGAKLLQPLVEPDRRKNKATFKKMLSDKNALFMKRTVEMIIKWNRKTNSKKIWHIHGSMDHTLPLRHLTADCIIKKGSHMMTLTERKKVMECIDLILEMQE